MGEDPKGKNCLQLPSVPITASHSCIFLQQPVESADFSDAPLNDLGLVYILFITTAVHTLPLTRTCTHLYTHTHKRTHIHLHTHTPTNPHCRLLGSIWQLRSDSAVIHTRTHTQTHTNTRTTHTYTHIHQTPTAGSLVAFGSSDRTVRSYTHTHTQTHTHEHTYSTHIHAHTPNPHCRLLGSIWQLRSDSAVTHTHTFTRTYTNTHTYTNKPPPQAPW